MRPNGRKKNFGRPSPPPPSSQGLDLALHWSGLFYKYTKIADFLIQCKLSCSDVAKEKLTRLFYQSSQLFHSIAASKLSKSCLCFLEQFEPLVRSFSASEISWQRSLRGIPNHGLSFLRVLCYCL